MPIVNKKTKNIQKDVLIKNQIATLLNKSIIPKPLQQTTVNADYYVSIYQNDNRDLSFNTTSNNLITKNLVIQNPPSCYVDASNSYDLVNKSHMNKYVGFDLYAGNKWYCEDWIRGVVSGNFNWVTTLTSGGTITAIASDISHVGIVRLTLGSNTNSSCLLTLPTNIGFFSSKVKSLRFLVRPFENANIGNVLVYYGIGNNSNSSTQHASWIYRNTPLISPVTQSWNCNINGTFVSQVPNVGNFLNSRLDNKWLLFEIEFDSIGKPSFYITLLRETNRILIYKEEGMNIVSTEVLIKPYAYMKNESTVSKSNLIDYIDWVVST